MLLSKTDSDSLESLFHVINLRNPRPGSDHAVKVQQILAYLEVVDAHVRTLSETRRLVFIDAGAGNAYLSFLLYHYYAVIREREISILCVDTNQRLMEKASATARHLGFAGMTFHTGDILETPPVSTVDLVYSLHACDTATDKMLYLGIKQSARCILSVACCQHTIRKRMTNRAVRGVTRYKAFKDRLVYMVADTMRGHLVAMHGYKVDVFEFTSSRNTDKNVMLRARRDNSRSTTAVATEYEGLRKGFGVEPELARLLLNGAKALRKEPNRGVPA